MAKTEELSIDERLLKIQERQLALQEAQLEEQKRARDVQQIAIKQNAEKSNVSPPKISAFNPRGEKDYPMPILKCEVNHPFPSRPNSHALDREEVELMNLTMPGSYMVELNDGTLYPVLITGRVNKATSDVASMRWSGILDEDTGHPTPLFTSETRQRFPALRTMLRQILGDRNAFDSDDYADQYGRDDSPALAVMPMKEEVRKVRQFMKAKTMDERDLAVAAGALSVSMGE